MLMNRDLTNDEIKQRYGLESYEWDNSLVNTMAAIVGKDMPDRDAYANALLRDGVNSFVRQMRDAEMQDSAPEGYIGDELHDAISQATWGGVIIDDPTMIAIEDADAQYVIPFGAASLASTYYEFHQVDDARLADLRLDMRFPQPTEAEIKQYYGLDPHEWTGSLADKVRTVINKNEPERDEHVNALLRDGAIRAGEKIQYFEDDRVRSGWLEPCVDDEGDKLYGAAMEAAWSGILIDDEAMAEISKIERDYVRPYGKPTLVQDYAQLHDLNNARAYYRQNMAQMQQSQHENVSSQSAQASVPAASVRAQRGPGQPVRVGDVAKQWMASMGRDVDGRPLAPSPESQKTSGTIQAALPGSSIKVGSAPRVPSTTRRMGAPAPQQARRDEASFEL
jgi:hypothetical protein